MKKIGKILLVTTLIAVIGAIPCMASENKSETDIGIPTRILVDGGYLELVDSSVDKDLQNGITRYAFHVVTNGGNLNVRSGPGFGYSVIGQFANGQVIDVSFWQESGIYPWVYATGTDCNTGNYIGGYIHSDYYQ